MKYFPVLLMLLVLLLVSCSEVDRTETPGTKILSSPKLADTEQIIQDFVQSQRALGVPDSLLCELEELLRDTVSVEIKRTRLIEWAKKVGIEDRQRKAHKLEQKESGHPWGEQ